MDTSDHISPWYQETGHPRWKYRTTRPLAFPGVPGSFSVRSVKSDRELASVTKDRILIHSDYYFDGLTGFPDVPKLMSAALIHDLLCQCLDHPGWPLDRAKTDLAFLREGSAYAPVWVRVCHIGLVVYWQGPRSLLPKKPDQSVRLVRLP